MEQLAWLPLHPDMAGALRVAKAEQDCQARLPLIAGLTSYRRDFVATERIDRLLTSALSECGPKGLEAGGLRPLRLAVLSSHTVDHLMPGIRVGGLNRRLALETYVAPYGLYRQILMTDDPQLREFSPGFILLALDAQNALFDLPLEASEAETESTVAAYVADLRQLWRKGRETYGAQMIQQTFIPTMPTLFGSFDGLVPASPAALVNRLNAAVRTAAREDGVLLVDVAWQFGSVSGTNMLVDPVRWHQAKQLINPIFAPLYGDLVARVAAAAIGLSRKCLVLDLDNTLWGGVVGDDGLEGIRLGQGNPEGEAFAAFQKYAAQLAARGVILAVCSKNEIDVAEAAFTGHPEMVLKRTDIAAFVANWNDKAGNIRAIAQMLNIGTDSLVFVDDNPAERDIVRRELPEVAVPELPEDPAQYPAFVAAAGYFEAAAFTADDVTRVRSYALNAEREASLAKATDMDGYLQSLEMRLVGRRIGPLDIARSTQLINKSNQFNLTTRRYTEAEMERVSDNNQSVSLCFRLKDRFGDNGLIGVALARPDAAWPDGEFLIDTWLMSCRVLGRGVEAATLDILISEAARRGARSLIGEYRPTAKNRMVEQHYPKLGFRPADPPANAADGATFWRFDLGSGVPPSHFIALDIEP